MKMLNKIIGGGVIAAVAFALNTQAQNLLVNADFDIGGLTGTAGAAYTPNFGNGGWTLNPIGPSGVGQGWALGGPGGEALQSDMWNAPIIDNPISAPTTLLEQQSPADSWNPTVCYQILAGAQVAGAGWMYHFSVNALTDTGITWNGGSAVDLQIQFLNANMANISTLDGGWGLAPGLNSWTSQTISGLSPVGTQYVSTYIMFMDHGNLTVEEVYFDNADLTVDIPEPSTLALLGIGLVIPFFVRRKS